MAEPISYEVVTETWQRMAETPSEDAQALIDQMEQEQPVVMVYLLALDEYPFNQTEKEIIFYLGAVLWEILKQSPDPLTMVNEETIDRVEEDNFRFLELLSNDTEADFMSATRALIDNYGEPEVLRYLVEALMEDEATLEDFEDSDLEEEEEDEEEAEAEEPLLDFTAEDAEALFEASTSLTLDELAHDFLIEYEGETDQDLDEDEEEWDDMSIRPEYRGLAFVHLKTVLDAFIASR
jgi:hypothetical protein